MKMKKRMGALALTAALLASLMTGCAGGSSNDTSGDTSADGGYSIGYVNLDDTDVFAMSRKTNLSAILEGTDYSISFTDGNNDNQKQIDQTNAFLAKGVDAMIIVPSDSEAIVPAITAANGANVPVICLGIKANGGDFIFVGSDSYQAGIMQGEYMAEMLPENAQILYCAGTAGLEHSALRRDGFKDALAEAGRDDVVILADQDCDYVKDEAMKTCDAWIQTYSDGQGGVTFDAIVCANDQMALGCMESLKGAGIADGTILISGVDGTDEAIAAVAEGKMAQTVLQDAPGQAQAAYEVLQKFRAGETVDGDVDVPFVSITADNVADFQ